MSNAARKLKRQNSNLLTGGQGAEFRMVEAGEKVTAMREQFQQGLDQCIAENKHRTKPYYILFHAQWTHLGAELRLIYSPRDKRPPKMLKTMCFKVDNKKGEIKALWILPPDAPSPIIRPDQKICEPVAQSVRGIPIIYG